MLRITIIVLIANAKYRTDSPDESLTKLGFTSRFSIVAKGYFKSRLIVGYLSCE